MFKWIKKAIISLLLFALLFQRDSVTLLAVEKDSSSGGIQVDESNFPDANFRNWILLNIPGAKDDGILTDAELAAVTRIDVEEKSIQNLTGIKYFTKLKQLNCGKNQIKNLDVSGMNELGVLWCYSNQMTSLNMQGLTSLFDLSCTNNPLGSLDLSGLTSLKRLECVENDLTSLNLSGLSSLKTFICFRNQLRSLDLSEATSLEYINCVDNNLSSLNLSGLTKLDTIYCESNELKNLDLTGLIALRDLNCTLNYMTDLSDLIEYHSENFTSFHFDPQKTIPPVDPPTEPDPPVHPDPPVNPDPPVHPPTDSAQENALKAAKDAAENVLYPITYQTPNGSENAVKEYVKTIAQTAVNNSSIEVAIDKISFIEPAAADAWKPAGTWGRFAFTITVSNNTGWLTTGQRTVVIIPDGLLEPAGIALDRKSVYLRKGENCTIQGTVSPFNALQGVTWVCDRASVAVVNSQGIVTATGNGTATITATTVNGITAVCRITVTEPVTGIITSNKETIAVGKKKQLTATTRPAGATDKISWKSSDKKYVTVDSKGKIKGIKSGKATITAKASNGKKVVCKVSVVKNSIKAKSVKLNKKLLSIKVAKEYQLRAGMSPALSTDSLKWSSSNSRVAKVDGNGIVTAKKKGFTTVEVKTTGGKRTSCKVTVK